MKNNIYLCVTEYHVLLSILIASETYNSDEYCNHIILCNGGRFNDMSRYNTNHTDNIEYSKVDEEDFVTSSFVNKIFSACTGELYLFNLNYKHFFYIAYKLKREKNVLTSFVQEGLASYIVQNNTLHRYLSVIRSSKKLFDKVGVNDFSFYRYCYGFRGHLGRMLLYYRDIIESTLVRHLWLTSPDGAIYGKSKVKKIPLFSEKSLGAAFKFFKYGQNHLRFKKNDILFVDQNLEGSPQFVSELSRQFPSSTIYIKLHPSAPDSLASEYQKTNNVIMINTLKGIPIDLLIQELKVVNVITPYSSALLIDNPSCHYYFMYPWLIENGYGSNIPAASIFNPTRFIKEINNVGEIDMFKE